MWRRAGLLRPWMSYPFSSSTASACQRVVCQHLNMATGRLAQWLERLLHTQEVRGSSPRPPTTIGRRALNWPAHVRWLGVRLKRPSVHVWNAEVAERQTRYVQDVVPARVCGFKSLLRHQFSAPELIDWLTGQSIYILRGSGDGCTRDGTALRPWGGTGLIRGWLPVTLRTGIRLPAGASS